MAYGIIYLVQNQANFKVYVGQTIQPLQKRWENHVYHCKNSHLKAAIAKYGADAFTVQAIADAENQEQLDTLEQLWIWALKSADRNLGYNKTLGGEGGAKTLEARASISRALTGRKLSAEHRRNVGLSRLGKPGHPKDNSGTNNPMFGRQHSAETKAKIAAVHRGKTLSKEHRAKISASSPHLSGKDHPGYKHGRYCNKGGAGVSI